MKNILTYSCLCIALFSFTQTTTKSKNKNSVQADYTAAVRLSQNEFDRLTSDYQTANQGKTLGGMISKNDLSNMIASMPSSDSYVNFRFATDDATGLVSVMFMGGKSWYEGNKKIDCLRNGGSAKAFCPSICDVNSTESDVTVDVDYNTFKLLSDAYKTTNPNKTWGGNIDKEAMIELLNSLPESTPNIAFRFCTDATFKQTAVVFVGGSVNQAPGSTLYLRNGVTAEGFCPSMCSVRD